MTEQRNGQDPKKHEEMSDGLLLPFVQGQSSSGKGADSTGPAQSDNEKSAEDAGEQDEVRQEPAARESADGEPESVSDIDKGDDKQSPAKQEQRDGSKPPGNQSEQHQAEIKRQESRPQAQQTGEKPAQTLPRSPVQPTGGKPAETSPMPKQPASQPARPSGQIPSAFAPSSPAKKPSSAVVRTPPRKGAQNNPEEKKQKKMLCLMIVLMVIFVAVILKFYVFTGQTSAKAATGNTIQSAIKTALPNLSGKTGYAGAHKLGKGKPEENSTEDEIQELWREPTDYPSDMRDPMFFSITGEDAFSGALVITGIVYNDETPMAVIDRRIVRAGDKIGDIEVVNITEETVVFQNKERTWVSRVSEKENVNQKRTK